MSLFDFFKKSNKKGQGIQPENEELFSPEQNKKRYDAAMDFLQYFQEKTPLLNGKPHPGTVLSIGAGLAGTSLFRAINKKDVDPGVVVLSEEVNQAYPQLLNLFAYYCKQNGIDVMAKPVVSEFPEGDKPLMELAQIQGEYQDQYIEIMNKHGLDYLESARAGMIVCSILFNYHCLKNKDIDPYVATGIVVMGIVEGAKTSPVQRNSQETTPASNNSSNANEAAELIRTIAESSVSGSGSRLVLGDKDAVVQEAIDNGGKFILVHPEVENQLKSGNFDPFLIYVTALTIEMESQISRIDFVKSDVGTLLQEWSDKAHDQASVHVRLMLWLQENAEGYGYQRNGNSWKRKG